MKIETPDECMSSLNTSDRCYCERCGKRNARSRCFEKSYVENKPTNTEDMKEDRHVVLPYGRPRRLARFSRRVTRPPRALGLT
jgi:predicted amidophosphoribosyltransferase